MEVRPENAETGHVDVHLALDTGYCILLSVSGVQMKVFRAKIRPENAVGMIWTEVGALFRFLYS